MSLLEPLIVLACIELCVLPWVLIDAHIARELKKRKWSYYNMGQKIQ